MTFIPKTARVGDLILSGGGEGDVQQQIDALVASLSPHGASLEDVCLLRVFYRAATVDEAFIERSIARRVGPDARLVLSLVPVGNPGLSGLDICMEAAAVRSAPGQEQRLAPHSDGPVCFVAGLRRGRFLFLGSHRAEASEGLVAESGAVMRKLEATLKQLGATFSDIVRMNRWYHAAGTKDEWEPSARAVAGFYREPGPIATALSLPSPLPGGRAIQIELMGMVGDDGRSLPKQHSWPEGHWDWPIHLPYKHGLACDDLVFVGGQVSLDGNAEVIDPGRQDLQVARSMANIQRVIDGFGRGPGELLHLGVYYEAPAVDEMSWSALRSVVDGAIPAVAAGFPYLSYPTMRVEIEAIAAFRNAG